MEPKLQHTCLTLALTLMGGSLFFKEKMCLFGKIEISLKSCFCVKYGFKKLPPDHENHLRLKNFFISEYLWNSGFTIES